MDAVFNDSKGFDLKSHVPLASQVSRKQGEGMVRLGPSMAAASADRWQPGRAGSLEVAVAARFQLNVYNRRVTPSSLVSKASPNDIGG
jgi:hypothetical protein